MTDAQIVALLRAKAKALGSQMKLAQMAGVSPQYVTDVLNGRRAAGTRLLRVIGYKMVREIRPM